MSRRSQCVRSLMIAVALGVLLAAPGLAETAGMKAGKVDLKSISSLEIGPDNVLFVADSEGAKVWAIDVGPAKAKPWSSGGMRDLDRKIAAMLGVDVRDVFVQDMAVHQGDGRVFLGVTRGSGDGAIPLLLVASGDDQIKEIDLSRAPHSSLELSNQPAADAKLYRWASRTFTITDLEYIDGELFITGLSNEEFASKLRRTPFPFAGDLSVTSLEIYHGAHGEWETFAPIFTFIPMELDGEQHILAGYLCTPLVTFPLDQVRKKQKLRGKTIAELGWGNTPTDIIAYESQGEQYVLIANSRRGMMKFKVEDILAANKAAGIESAVDVRAGVDYKSVALGYVSQIADLDDGNIMLLGREMENGELYLATRPKRRL